MKRVSIIMVCAWLASNSEAQNVGIGISTPQNNLHLHSGTSSSTLQLSNDITGSGIGQGGTVRMLGGNFLITNQEATGFMSFSTNSQERLLMTANGNIGINNNDPQTVLHINARPGFNEALRIGGTTPFQTFFDGANYRGYIQAWIDGLIVGSTSGNALRFFTNTDTERMTIDNVGNVGIGTTTPNHKLDIRQTGNNSRGINVIVDNGMQNTFGVVVQNFNQTGSSFLPAVGVWAITGTGSTSFSPTSNYGIIGESRSESSGFGVLGISRSPSPNLLQAAVSGFNSSSAASAYGIIGSSQGSSGAGTVGYTSNATAGLLGYAYFNSTGSAIKSISLEGSAQIGLELENGALKVSGAKRTVFQHTTTAANTISNETAIPNASFANAASDMLIITPVWNGTYVNAPLGVYFATGTWRIFRQDQAAMPVGVTFNVLVVKQ